MFIGCIVKYMLNWDVGFQVSSLTLKNLEGATSADLAEIEQIVKERMVRNFYWHAVVSLLFAHNCTHFVDCVIMPNRRMLFYVEICTSCLGTILRRQ